MQQMDGMEALMRRMHRVNSALDMIQKAGHLAGADNVIEVCWLIQKEVVEIVEEMEQINQPMPQGKDEAPEKVPAPAEVLPFSKPQPRA
ncbi:hypothetical protein [Pseudomonas luteola]|uniref:hypothetical protein n=1 Tax=Pseudomonas luteola TaxID=47886 RepID=UPI0015E410A2|nr:hypothetical protein [Pseudomonas zeshuii]MBA1250943.1 hypothetical protein [Pseudomonas zeshuii]